MRGVPLTYPGGGDTVTLVRGHEDESQTAPAIDWASLAKLKGTIVCYAGTKQLPAILDALISHGRAKTESAAVIYEGTLPGQQTVEGTLGELAELTSASRPRRPAILVVGRVAALRQHLRWFDERPLFGQRVVVTRPREDAADLVDRLAVNGRRSGRGADDPDHGAGGLGATRSRGGRRQHLRVDRVHQRERRRSLHGAAYRGDRDVRELKGVRLCAVGPSTRDRLSRYGVRIDLVPTDFRAEGVVDALARITPLKDTRFLLPRADFGRERLAEALRSAGAEVTDVMAYRTLPAEPDPIAIRTSIGCCSIVRSTW